MKTALSRDSCAKPPEDQRSQNSLSDLSIACFHAAMLKFFAAALTVTLLHATLPGIASPAVASDTLGFRKPDSVPVSWTRYAQLVQYMLGEWLSDGSTEAQRLHNFLQNRLLDTEADAPPENRLPVSLWIDSAGEIKKAAFAPLGDAQADSDLRTLLEERRLGEAPPEGMLMPLQLNLRLDWRS